MDPMVDLVRRYVEDWLNAADPAVCEAILDPGYTLHIGGQALAGRDDAYVPATMGQLRQFPGLLVTVHDLLVGRERIALRFSEHGASTRHDGRTATWGGIVLFGWDGQRLTEAWVEEDYLSRRSQLADQPCAPIEAPMDAPWEQVSADGAAESEEAVRRWLGARDADGDVAYDDLPAGAAEPLLAVADVEVHQLFSAGTRVAFHASQRGQVSDEAGAAVLHSAGIVDVIDGRVTAGRVIRDRLGLLRAQRAGGS